VPITTSWVFRFIESDSDSKILNRPHLSTLSRQPAAIHQGGEKGYEVINDQSANVVWKPWGVILKVTPELTKEGRIRCVMNFEVSAPVGEKSLDFLTHRSEATALLDPGQSMVVAGLVQDIQKNFKKGVPFLSRIPLFGHFFTSHEDSANKRDLVVVITPRIAIAVPGPSEGYAKEQLDRVNPVQLRWVEQLNEDTRLAPPVLMQHRTPEQKLRSEMKDRREVQPVIILKPKAEAEPPAQPETPVQPAATEGTQPQAAAPETEPKAEVTAVPQEPTLQASKD
jgi:hypothetical protein